MPAFTSNLNNVANDVNSYLKKFFSNDKNLKIVSELIDLLNVENYQKKR